MNNKLEKDLKKWLKRKVRFTQALMIAFLITGGFAYSESINEDREGVETVVFWDKGSHNFDSANIKLVPKADDDYFFPWGLAVLGNSNITINGPTNIDLTSTLKLGEYGYVGMRYFNLLFTADYKSEEVAVSHGIFVGTSPDAESLDAEYVGTSLDAEYVGNYPAAEEKITKLKTEDVTINMTNTEDTTKDKLKFKLVGGAPDYAAPVFFRDVLGKDFKEATGLEESEANHIYISLNFVPDFSHQLTGVRVTNDMNRNDITPEFESTGNLKINVKDSSASKVGDYLTGVYVSGNKAKATLNNSDIIIEANGEHSAAIKIGEANPVPYPEVSALTYRSAEVSNYADDYEGASVISKGHMKIDTTKTADSAAIRLFGNKSKLIANSETSSGEIKSGNSAVVFDVQDLKTKLNIDIDIDIDVPEIVITSVKDPIEVIKTAIDKILEEKGIQKESIISRNENGLDNEVSLRNTKISTVSETASLIKARAILDENKTLDGLLEILPYGYVETGALPIYESRAMGEVKEEEIRFSGPFASENAKFTLEGEESLARAAKKGWLAETEAVEGAAASMEFNLDDKAVAVGLMNKQTVGEYSSKLDVNVKNGATWKLEENAGVTEQRSTINSLTLDKGILDATTQGAQAKTNYIIKLTSDGKANDGTLKNIGGTIDLANKSYEDVLTIEGNYEGADAKLRVNTEWNTPGDAKGANSKSDKLVIMGDASGTTKVIPVSKDGKEKIIDGSIGSIAADLKNNSVPVVEIKGNDLGETAAKVASATSTSGTTFTGTAQTTGAGEVQLASRTAEDGTTEYYWTVTSTGSGEPIPIYSPAVAAYTQAPRVNLDLGYSTLATLHERRGENQILSWDKYVAKAENKDQLWARLLKVNRKVEGKKRFEYKTDIDGVQVGNDFRVDYDGKGGYRLTGGYFAYAKADTKFYDRFRFKDGLLSADKFTGKADSEIFALGLTSTKYFADGAYFDLVGQVSYIRNEYKIPGMNKSKQKGSGVAVSAEVGQPYVLSAKGNSSWNLEPQAQLIYQTLKLEDFNDGVRRVDDDRQIAFRGRIGARLTYNKHGVGDKVGTKTFYGIANVWQDFLRNNGTRIGADRVKEKYARTTGEIGLGVQLPISDSSYVYTDLRYEHSLGGRKVKGYKGTVGLKYTW